MSHESTAENIQPDDDMVGYTLKYSNKATGGVVWQHDLAERTVSN